MKVFIQNCATKQFLKGETDEWCAAKEDAKVFGSSVEALEFCIRHGLKEVQLLLKFHEGNHEDEMIVPLKNANGGNLAGKG